MPPPLHPSRTACRHSPGVRRSCTQVGVMYMSKEKNYTNITFDRVPAWESVSCIIGQFEESPATAQVSSLPSRLKHKHIHFGFFCFTYNCPVICHIGVICAFVCVLTFRINVTPNSKRIPRLGDVEVQRRKQSPSRRVGRIPITWNKHTHEHMLSFSFCLFIYLFLAD